MLGEDPDFKKWQSNFEKTGENRIEIRKDSFNSVDYRIEKRDDDLYGTVYLHFKNLSSKSREGVFSYHKKQTDIFETGEQ